MRHSGGLDVFLATLDEATAGDILVIDNAGRSDEGCVGELVTLEAAAAGIGGLVVWGCHRDSSGLTAIDLPVFSLGACPLGPRRPSSAPDNPSPAVIVGSAIVNPGDVVAADGDGVIVIAPDQFGRVLPVAREIQQSEHVLADDLADGHTLREQWRFDAFLALRRVNPSYSFRDHMRELQSRRPA